MPVRLVLVCLALALTPTATAAQQVTDAERAVARQEYENGVAAARDERWEEAGASFQAAWEIIRLPTILYNLAGAQEQTGALVEAAESYRRFLREARDGGDLALRADAEQYLAAVLARTPAILLTIDGLASSDRVVLDDDDVAHAVLGRPMPVNPGEHAISVRRGGDVLTQESFRMAEEERRTIEMSVPELVAGTDPIDGADTATAQSGSIIASPITWIVVGAVVAAGVVAAFFLTRSDDQSSPFESSLEPVRF